MSDIVRTVLDRDAQIEKAKRVVGEMGKLVNDASRELGQQIGTDILVNFVAGMIVDCKVNPEKFFAAVLAAMEEFRKDEN